VKNQGACGSCWAFSTTGVTESVYYLKNRSLPSLSEQQLVDCSGSYGNLGCNGGMPSSALRYIQSNGIVSENDYRYEGKDGTCRASGKTVVTKVSG